MELEQRKADLILHTHTYKHTHIQTHTHFCCLHLRPSSVFFICSSFLPWPLYLVYHGSRLSWFFFSFSLFFFSFTSNSLLAWLQVPPPWFIHFSAYSCWTLRCQSWSTLCFFSWVDLRFSWFTIPYAYNTSVCASLPSPRKPCSVF